MSNSRALNSSSITTFAGSIPNQADYQRLRGEVTPGSNNQVTLVGAFAVLIQAYGSHLLPPRPNNVLRHQVIQPGPAEFIPFDALGPILGSPFDTPRSSGASALPFSEETIPLEIRCKIAGKDLRNDDRLYCANPPIIDIESLAEAIPSVKRNYLASGTSLTQEYVVATGPYLALELIRTHLSGSKSELEIEHEATLAIFLHALVLLAPYRASLHLPTHIKRDGKVVLSLLESATIDEIKDHRDFRTRWTPFLAKFLSGSWYNDLLAQRATDLYGETCSGLWERSMAIARLANTRENFQRWIRHSIDQISEVLNHLAPLPSISALLDPRNAPRHQQDPYASASPRTGSNRRHNDPFLPHLVCPREPQGLSVLASSLAPPTALVGHPDTATSRTTGSSRPSAHSSHQRCPSQSGRHSLSPGSGDYYSYDPPRLE